MSSREHRLVLTLHPLKSLSLRCVSRNPEPVQPLVGRKLAQDRGKR